MNAPVIINTQYYSDGFPRIDDTLERNNCLNEIKYALDEFDVIFFEGPEDSGKTTLLGQYVNKYPQSISVFFNPLSSLDYRMDYYYRNVSLQICALLNEDVDSIEYESIGTYEFYLRKVQDLIRKMKSSHNRIPLIIDGIESNSASKRFVEELFAHLPFKKEPFKIILSGSQPTFYDINKDLKKLNCKTVTLGGFSDLEIKHYLGIEEIPNIEEIVEITKGLAGRLANIKRKLKEGVSIEEIIDKTDYSEIIEEDCEAVNLDDPNILKVLSILSLSDRRFKVEDLAKVASLSEELVSNLIADLDVVKICDDEIRFVSKPHRDYFKNHLRGKKTYVDELLIQYLVRDDSVEAIEELPEIYLRTDKFEDVINIVKKDSMIKLLEKSGSLKHVNSFIDTGIKASKKMNSFKDLWNFTIQGSIVNELDNYLFWESEIDARTALRDYDGAILLANSAILNVDRLSLLSLIAKRQKELDHRVETYLETMIRELYKEVDLINTGQRVYEIVSNLIYALPNIAIEILEGSDKDDSDLDININDWIAAKVSKGAIDSSINEDDKNGLDEKLKTLEKLKTPYVNKLNRAIKFLVGNYDSQKVLQEVRKLTDSSERLKLVRLWLMNYKGEEDVTAVIELGLEELISQASIFPDIRELGELARLLPSIQNTEKRKELYSKFRRIEGDFKDSPLIRNRFKYQLSMFSAKFQHDPSGAVQQLNTIFEEVSNLTDDSIKLEVYAEIYSVLCKIPKKNSNSSLIQSTIKRSYKELLSLVEIVFDQTSYHEEISRSTIQVIGRENPRLALKIIDKINTEGQRMSSLETLMESYLENKAERFHWYFFEEIMAAAVLDDTKEELVQLMLERFSEESEVADSDILKLIPYFDKVEGYSSFTRQTYNYTCILKILSLNERYGNNLKQKYSKRLKQSWEEIGTEWTKVDIGFKICSELPIDFIDFSKNLFKECCEIKDASWIDSRTVAHVYINSIKIILQAYTNLVLVKDNDREHIQKIKGLIDRIPSNIARLDLWTECCFGVLETGQRDLLMNIMDQYVVPELRSAIEGTSSRQIEFVPEVFTLLTIHSLPLANHYKKHFSDIALEHASVKTIEYLMVDENPYKPYDQKRPNYSTDFSKILSAIELMDNIFTDAAIYYCVELICTAVSKCSKSIITDPQITTLIERLNALVGAKLPDTRNINHEGYLIICLVKILSIKRRDVTKQDWENLILRSRSITNNSDKVLVLSVILDNLPTSGKLNMKPESIALYRELVELIDGLKENKVHYEFIKRVLDISEIMHRVNRKEWKEKINEAFLFSKELQDDSEKYSIQRSMIDSIYKLNPEFAKELTERLGDEEERSIWLNKRIKNHYESLEMSKRIREKQTIDDLEVKNRQIFVSGVYNSLKQLNSNLITPKKINDLMNYLPHSNKAPLHEVFPVFSYYLVNCQKVYQGKNLEGRVRHIHRENFDKAVEATDLTEILLQRKKMQLGALTLKSLDAGFSNKVFHPGSKQEAMSFIKDWMHDNLNCEEVMIMDPYFSWDELDILKDIRMVNGNIHVKILTSKDGNIDGLIEKYEQEWSNISEEEVPKTDITYCWLQTASGTKEPFHDRYIFVDGAGLRLGTSFNGLGSKESEISVMSKGEIYNIRTEIFTEYFERRKRSEGGEKLKYKVITL